MRRSMLDNFTLSIGDVWWMNFIKDHKSMKLVLGSDITMSHIFALFSICLVCADGFEYVLIITYSLP